MLLSGLSLPWRAGFSAAESTQTHAPNAKWVWDDEHGRGRNVFAHFRHDFHLGALPDRAGLHLMADTRYRLRVNGHFAGSGPAAFLLSHPEYDTIDLRPWLRRGHNVITVEVNSRGDRNFQAEPSRGGFIAWGSTSPAPGDEAVNFATPGDWRTRRAGAWSVNSPNFSFAQGPVEIVDLRALPTDENAVDLAAADWREPDVVAAPNWGPLQPRSVAAPAFDIWAPSRLLMLCPLRSELVYLSANRATQTADLGTGTDGMAAMLVWLHSPAAKTCPLSLWKGSYWLNGAPLPTTSEETARPAEVLAAASLRAGWNLLYGETPCAFRGTSAMVAWPRDAGLRAAPEPDTAFAPDALAPALWLSSFFPEENPPSKVGNVPDDLTTAREFVRRWDLVTGPDLCPMPTYEVGWDRPAAEPVAEPERVQGREIPRSAAGEGFAIFDFGREFIGHVVLEIDAPHGGILDLANDELQQEDGSVRMLKRINAINPVERLHLRAGRNRWEGFHVRGGRLLQLTARSSGPVVIQRIALRNALVRVPAAGSFTCSDEVFNWAWTTGVATLEASLVEGWVDPWREQGLYVGDTLVQYLAHRAWTRDTTHIVRALRLWGRSQTPDGQILAVAPAWPLGPHADYTLIWIMILRDYAQQTGDVALADELWPVVERIWSSPSWRPGPHGLWHGDDMRVFCDWGAPRESVSGEANGVLNAFRVGALEATSQLAGWRGDTANARRYAAQRVAVIRAFREQLWDPRKDAFAARLDNGRPGETSAAHANALALRYGIASAAQEDGALRVVRANLAGMMADPGRFVVRSGQYELYFLHYVLELLGARGLHEEAETVIRRFWGLQKDHGAWCLWEAFYRGLRQQDSQCHGWATGPNVYFHRTVLGIEVTPDRVVIEPNAHTLTQARGVHPHPRGDVRVAWRIADNAFHLDVELPAGLTHEVRPGRAFAHLQPMVNIQTYPA